VLDTPTRPAGRDSLVFRAIPAGMALPIWFCIGAWLLGACTLSSSDFQPVKVEGQLAGNIDDVADDVPGPDSLSCNSGSDCPADAQCVAGVCVPGACVSSEDVSSCVSQLCAGGCSVWSCNDGERGPQESDIDCGGPCRACDLGADCTLDSQCSNGTCVAGECREAACDDSVKNGAETDVDCGGLGCDGCLAEQSCAGDADCQAPLVCAAGARVCTSASCQDGDLNGSEVALDCGGGCPGCAVGVACNVGTDCASGVCGPNQLCAAPTCSDGVDNQDETDVDCGGPCPATCLAGRACGDASDCQSGVCGAVGCAAGVGSCCQVPSCGDGVSNGGEPVTDCGNAACGLCATDAACTADAQCQTGLCGGAGTCEVPLVCGDGALNGNEGDTDCGGTEAGCPRCEDGLRCRADGDCASANCSAALRCVSCNDGLQNGDEGGVDCGGSEPGCPACPRCTVANSTDMATVGAVTTHQANGCAKISQFPSYPPTLVESYDFGQFPIAFSWRQECTGQSGSSTFDHIYHQRQLIGMSTACPIVFELSGSATPVGLRFW
jgi:hypothetical protein